MLPILTENKDIQFRFIQRQETGVTFEGRLKICYMLRGTAGLRIQGNWFVQKPGDIFVINPYESHSWQVDDQGVALILSFSSDLYRKAGLTEKKMILCRSCLYSDNEKVAFQKIRRQIHSLFDALCRSASDNHTEAYGISFLLMAELLHFSKMSADESGHTSDAAERLRSVLNYMSEHLEEGISLNLLAEREHLSPNYLSRLFRKHLGTSFTEQMTQLRLDRAVVLLRETDCSITQIAYEIGFKSTNAFIKYFRKAFDCTPGAFRRNVQTNPLSGNPFPEDELIEALLNEKKTAPQEKPSASPVALDIRRVSVPCGTSGKVLKHRWKQMLSVNYAKDCLLGPVQEQLRSIQREIGFSYIYFHGILDDSMMVYTENVDGTPQYYFAFVDMLFDFLLSIGLRPYLELGFMPRKLSINDHRLFQGESIISLPNDPKKWHALVRALVEHCVKRYGIEEVQKWYFTPLSAVLFYHRAIYPNLLKSADNWESDYCGFYHLTYDAIKSVSSSLCFGGPGIDINLAADDSVPFLSRFLEWSDAQGYFPDFIRLQCYPHRIGMPTEDLYPHIETNEMPVYSLDEDPDFICKMLTKLEKRLARHHLGLKDVVIDIWNSTLWQRDLCNDTCYKAAYIMKNILENYDRLQAFCYWNLSDISGETAFQSDTFRGSVGLITYNGLKKSGYHAMWMLGRMQNRVILQNPGYFITSGHGEINILVYHYTHYTRLYGFHYASQDDIQNPYNVFPQRPAAAYLFCLESLEPGTFEIEQHTISRDHGSSYDTWVEMGRPETMNTETLSYINAVSAPKRLIYRIKTDGSLEIRCTLKSHECTMIRIRHVD